MTISLLDGALRVTIYYSAEDSAYEDNICLSLLEDCPKDEKLFRSDETNIYITAAQARALAQALLEAAAASEAAASATAD